MRPLSVQCAMRNAMSIPRHSRQPSRQRFTPLMAAVMLLPALLGAPLAHADRDRPDAHGRPGGDRDARPAQPGFREHPDARRAHPPRPLPWQGDIRRFHERDLDRWHSGRWVHSRHDGHLGWWWVIGPTWYLYSAPVYPWPDPYMPPTILSAPPPPAGTVLTTPSQYWYYCADPEGYYPYVPQCRVPWQAVPPTPR